MICDLRVVSQGNRGITLRCSRCGRPVTTPYSDPAKTKRRCVAPSQRAHSTASHVHYGAGAELTALFAELGITEKPGCNCKAIAADMDRAGVAGCRKRRDYFLGKLNENAQLYSLGEKIKACKAAWSAGVPLTLAGMFDEAVRRAAAKDAWQPVRNCIYHVAALKTNDHWLRNVEQIKKRWDVFTGQRVIAYATGDACHPLAAVHASLPAATIIEVPNDPRLREVASFGRLLREVASTNPNEVTFYAHTKGNSTAESIQASIRWRNAMYHYLMDDVEQVRRALCNHAFCGTHKIQWQDGNHPYPSGLKIGTWMHAGTFWWFRHDRVFTKDWQQIADDRYAAEAWPSTICAAEDAWSMYQPWPDRENRPNPYDVKWYPAEFDDA
jgi:hypothetical protein